MSVQLQRAIDILELVEASERPLALGEIAERVGMAKPAAHRLLQVFVERGYMEQEPVGQRYVATLKLALIGFRHLAATGLRDVCVPELRKLANETGELARLAVVEHGALTWVAEAQGARDGLRYDGNLGRQAILHATAAGKAWLATLSDEEAVRLVLAQGFRAPPETGPNAVRTVEGLLRALADTRARGYATAFEEAALGVNAVAVAVVDAAAGGGAVASIIVVGPAARMTAERLAGIVPALGAAAERIGALWPIRRHTAREDARGAA
jgi:IclR family acetate operon transcriptional repressor